MFSTFLVIQNSVICKHVKYRWVSRMRSVRVLEYVLNLINDWIETANFSPVFLENGYANGAIIGNVEMEDGSFEFEPGRRVRIVLRHMESHFPFSIGIDARRVLTKGKKYFKEEKKAILESGNFLNGLNRTMIGQKLNVLQDLLVLHWTWLD